MILLIKVNEKLFYWFMDTWPFEDSSDVLLNIIVILT